MKVLQYICRVIQSVSMATIPVKATGSANQTFLTFSVTLKAFNW